MKERIKVYLYNKTMKEIDMSDFSYISEDVFSERTDIVKVVLPEGVKEIGNNAFENCIHLEEVVCPKSLQKIDSEAFIDCISLKKLIMTQHQLRWMQVHLRGVIIFKIMVSGIVRRVYTAIWHGLYCGVLRITSFACYKVDLYYA